MDTGGFFQEITVRLHKSIIPLENTSYNLEFVHEQVRQVLKYSSFPPPPVPGNSARCATPRGVNTPPPRYRCALPPLLPSEPPLDVLHVALRCLCPIRCSETHACAPPDVVASTVTFRLNLFLAGAGPSATPPTPPPGTTVAFFAKAVWLLHKRLCSGVVYGSPALLPPRGTFTSHTVPQL